jgi:hypothetical protein
LLQVLETLVKIKQHDPVIYRKDVVLFPEEAEQQKNAVRDATLAAAGAAAGRKSKPLFLRTVLAQQVGPCNTQITPHLAGSRRHYIMAALHHGGTLRAGPTGQQVS